MRALSLLSSKFTRIPRHLIAIRIPSISLTPQHRSLHDDLPSTPPPTATFAPPPPSRILHPNPQPALQPDAAELDDGPLNEFLSRFVWAIRGKLSDAYPSLSRDTLDGMLLVISRKVLAELEGSEVPQGAGDPAEIELSPDLWRTISEVSASVHEAMRRDHMREELKGYLHCDEVKEKCRFAGDVGIRGNLLRELRFKWARDKLDEVEFYRGLERIREQGNSQEEIEKAMEAGLEIMPGGREALSSSALLTALPQRKGRIKYKIHGLDLSDPEWVKVAERVEEAEREFVLEEAQPIVGQCKKADDKILALDAKNDNPSPALAEWAEILKPKRVDWIALLERIKERDLDLYFKVAELLLDEESFVAIIRDYSRLIDAHSKANRMEDAERILKKMTDKGIAPDVLTSIILVHMYSKTGNLDRAKNAFDSLKEQGFKPDLKLYSSMIAAYVNAGLPKQGEVLMREMDLKDIKPTKDIYMEILRAFAKRGQVDGAQRTASMMQFAGIASTLESFTLLVEAYAQAEKPDQAEARAQFDHMMKSGHRPDDRCTAGMMLVYLKKNLLDKALSLLLDLEKDGFEPGIATYTVLVEWMGRLQLVEEAERLVSMIRVKGEAPFEIHVSLCDMYAKGRQEEKARRSLRVLEGKKELIRGDDYERIVNGLIAGGMAEDAKRMYNAMQARGFSPSEQLRVAFMAAQSIPRPNMAGKRGR